MNRDKLVLIASLVMGLLLGAAALVSRMSIEVSVRWR